MRIDVEFKGNRAARSWKCVNFIINHGSRLLEIHDGVEGSMKVIAVCNIDEMVLMEILFDDEKNKKEI